MVPKEGLEPSRAYTHYALNVARLPIPPLRHGLHIIPMLVILSSFPIGCGSLRGRGVANGVSGNQRQLIDFGQGDRYGITMIEVECSMLTGAHMA